MAWNIGFLLLDNPAGWAVGRVLQAPNCTNCTKALRPFGEGKGPKRQREREERQRK